jgi:hypothetical protein
MKPKDRVYSWRSTEQLPERVGQSCRVVPLPAWLPIVAVEFEDGVQVQVERRSLHQYL